MAPALRALRKKRWVVYTKPPFGSNERALAYLGPYTHSVAISNSRLVSADDTDVTFRWSDHRHGNAPRYMTLAPPESIRRFLLHCLPDGFQRIRHYGFLANGIRRAPSPSSGVSMPDQYSPEGGADEFLDCLCCNSEVPAVFRGAKATE
ncbi:transposase [Ensifer sp. ENS07]|nr:transposase [Ensifer sp. ENS07]